jgi:hypothetical protein
LSWAGESRTTQHSDGNITLNQISTEQDNLATPRLHDVGKTGAAAAFKGGLSLSQKSFYNYFCWYFDPTNETFHNIIISFLINIFCVRYSHLINDGSEVNFSHK